MTTQKIRISVMALAAALALQARARDADYRFQLGLSYASGVLRVQDALEAAIESAQGGWSAQDTFMWPVGLRLSPYLEFSSGLGVGASAGPPVLVIVDNWLGPDCLSWIVPLGLDVRYTFLRKREISPYVRAGFRYPVAGGDFIDSSTIGGFGAVGVEFQRQKRISFGLEAAYDSSQVKIKGGAFSRDVRPFQVTISLFALF